MIKTPEQIFKEKKISGMVNADFQWSEYISPADSNNLTLEQLKNAKKILDILSIYKHKVFGGAPISITSGGRSMAHHIAIYKDLNAERAKKDLPLLKVPLKSGHLLFLAVDFTVKGFTRQQVYCFMDRVHWGGVEIPDDQDRTHIDLRPELCRFNGQTGRVVAYHYNLEAHNKVFH